MCAVRPFPAKVWFESMKKLVLLFAACLSLFIPAAGSFGKTIVLYPVDGSIVNEGGGLLVGMSTDDAVQSIQVKFKDKEYEVELWDGVFDLDLTWDKGENTLIVDGDETITFKYDPYYSDSGSQSVSVHQAALDNCANCHRLGENRDTGLLEDASALCFKCHEIVGEGFEHSTVGCEKCHESHVSWMPHLLKGKGVKFCSNCHSSLKTGLKSHHAGNFYKLDCPSCHDFVKKNSQCHSCHAKHTTKSTPHGFLWDKNACVSCHLPHEPNIKYSLLCKDCHPVKIAKDSSHADIVKMQCEACHLMHGDANGIITASSVCASSCHPVLSGRVHVSTNKSCSDCHGIHVKKTPPKE